MEEKKMPCKKVFDTYQQCMKQKKKCKNEFKILKICKRITKYGTF